MLTVQLLGAGGIQMTGAVLDDHVQNEGGGGSNPRKVNKLTLNF